MAITTEITAAVCAVGGTSDAVNVSIGTGTISNKMETTKGEVKDK